MPLETKLLIACVSVAIMAVIVHLVRKKRLDEKYALLWLVAGAVLTIAPLAAPVIDAICRALGVSYPPALVLLVAFLSLCLVNLQYSVVISGLTKQNRTLAQRLALLERRSKDPDSGPAI